MEFASRKRSKRPTKTRKQRGGVSDNIKQLLNIKKRYLRLTIKPKNHTII